MYVHLYQTNYGMKMVADLALFVYGDLTTRGKTPENAQWRNGCLSQKILVENGLLMVDGEGHQAQSRFAGMVKNGKTLVFHRGKSELTREIYNYENNIPSANDVV